MENALKKVAVILLILIVCLISFVGIYAKKLNRMENILPEYQKSMDLAEKRINSLKVDTSSNTVYYDADGNEVDEETEGGTSKEIPVNPSEALTAENYAKSKEILINRLKSIKANEYYLRQDDDGDIVIELPEDDMTDFILYTISQTGKFEMLEEDSDKVLLDNSDIEKAEVLYNSDTDGVTVYLSINLNKEGTAKLAEISKTYVKTQDEEGNDTTKNIVVKMDDVTLANTYFGQAIENGTLQISVGSPSTATASINSNYEQALIYATILSNGQLPIVYSSGEYANVVENTQAENFVKTVVFAGLVALAIIIVYLVIRYKVEGLLASILQIGFIAFLLLIIRYTNCVLSINGVAGIIVISLFQFAFLNALLKDRKRLLKTSKSNFNEVLIKYLKLEIPIDIIALLYTFSSWTPISSLGMILFWGAVLFAIYNAVIAKAVIVENKK